MTASIPARVSFWSGVAALGLVVLNQTTAASTTCVRRPVKS